MNSPRSILLLIVTLCLLLPSERCPADEAAAETKTAIVIAGFGTTVPRGVVALDNINRRIREAFPQTEVRLTFTSNMVRAIWRKRRAEAQQWLDQGVPPEILSVKNLLTTIGELQEEGFRNIIVQPTHMFYMEQSHDLGSFVRAIASIDTVKERWRPFDHVVMGRPALGQPGETHDYNDDIRAVVQALAADAEMARKNGAALVYMGHGNEHWSTGIYSETQKEMRRVYADVDTFIGVVEGFPALEDLLAGLEASGKKKVILKPFMISAGDHAMNDMAGSEEGSWKFILEHKGYQVQPVLEGLGSNDAFAEIFVSHIRDVAAQHGLKLR